MAKSAATVFFDLDGTLTDPKPGIVGCIQYALARLDLEVPETEELTWCIGPPLTESFAGLLPDPGLIEQAVHLYRERFGEIGLYENRVYDGVMSLLEQLCDLGLRLNVATSKPHVFANRIIDHFGLSSYFDGIYGSELNGERTDKTELLAFALEHSRTRAGHATMIGDRRHDIVGALNNGLNAIGIIYGYGTHEELIDAGAHEIVATPAELASTLIAKHL